MPGNLTHMYTACRLAQDFGAGHANDVIKDINAGFREWLASNANFSKGAGEAISANDGGKMQRVMDAYRVALQTDKVAIFSAFAAGSQGPDLWVLPHTKWDTLHNKITGTTHFDLGHYNLTHSFPRTVLERIRSEKGKISDLQRRYQTAYIFGYISHIGLDITGHIKVNVFAGAYFQLEKIWENEYGFFSSDSFLAPNVWSNHNKIEHYVDSYIRFVCFEGCHPLLSSCESVRRNDFEQSDSWDFPNYTDYWNSRLKFGKVFITNGINNVDEVFLDNSTSLPGPFAERYHSSDSNKKVVPFIHKDFLNAYSLCDSRITEHKQSIKNLESEQPKLNFYRQDGNSDLTSQYYLVHTICPKVDRVADFVPRFMNISAFGKFIGAARKAGKELIEGAVKYLDSGDTAVFEKLRNWNLDTGLAIRIKDISKETDKAHPDKPPRPVMIDFVNVIDEIKALSDWQPPALDACKYRKKTATREKPKKTAASPKKGAVIEGKTGTEIPATFSWQSGIDVRLRGFKLYSDSDELAGYLFGENPAAGVLVDLPEAEHAYKMSTCIEDFVTADAFVATKTETAGKAKVQEFRTTFLGNIFSPPHGGGKVAPEFGLRLLPRNLRVSLCRKYVFKPTNSGTFSPDRLNIYSDPFPTEELTASIYALVKNGDKYTDLFSHSTFSQSNVDQLKHIKQIGVNVVLLLLERDTTSAAPAVRLKLLNAWVDGDRQFPDPNK